jgi:exonuclease SbcC
MIPRKIKLHDFLSYADAEVDLSACHLVVLAGENGAGKSALAVDAITWALWGESRARSDDDLVRQGADVCEVGLVVDAHGTEYEIRRSRRLARQGRAAMSTLGFTREEPNGTVILTAETIRETQERINAAIGLDYSTFINTACLIQGRADEFTRAAPGDRKKVLASLLGLERWQQWAAAVHTETALTESALNGVDGVINRTAETIAPLEDLLGKTAALEARADGLAQELADAHAAAESAREAADAQTREMGERDRLKREVDQVGLDLKAKDNQIYRMNEDIKQAPKAEDVASLRTRVATLEIASADYPAMQQAGSEFSLASEQLDSTRKQNDRDVQRLTHAMEALGKLPWEVEIGGMEECPTCGQKLHDAAAEEKARATMRLQRANAQAAVDQAQEAVDKGLQAQTDIGNRIADMPAAKIGFAAAFGTARQAAEEIGTVRASLARAEERLEGAERLGVARDAMVEESAVLGNRLGDLRDALAAKEQALEDGAGRVLAFQNAEGQRRGISEAVEQVRRARDEMKGRVQHLQEMAADLARARTQRAGLATDLDLERVLEKAFGARGVQALLIDFAIPEIVDEANRLLALMSGGSTTIDMTTQRTGKSTGREIETLDVVIQDAQGVRPYENYSGGERFRIDFALRIALSRLLARRANAPCKTLIVDEGFGSQDGNGRTGLVEALATVSDQFSLVMVISHVDDVRDIFPATVTVRKGMNGSEASLS